MGKHRSKEERLEALCAEMRERQRLKKEAAKAGAVAVVDTRKTGAVVVPTAPKAERAHQVVGFTFGKPLPRRTKAELRQAWKLHKRAKNPPKPRTPGCRCGTCPKCAHRVAHAEYVRQRRERAKEGLTNE